MVRAIVHVVDTKDTVHVMEELPGEGTAVVREEIYGWTVIEDPLIRKAVRHLCG